LQRCSRNQVNQGHLQTVQLRARQQMALMLFLARQVAATITTMAVDLELIRK
jgi:hypothetical protein